METIIDLFERSCTKFSQKAYLWEKKKGRYVSMTYEATRARVMLIAAGLLDNGLKKGQRVALLSEGCNDWVCSELGILYAGGCCVPLSIKLTKQELIFRIEHSAARYVIVSAYYAEILKSIRKELTTVEFIFVYGNDVAREAGIYSFEQLIRDGKRWLAEHKGRLEQVMDTITASDVANISYTSGTTAEPKGIMLTHGNYVCNVLQADSLIRIPSYYRVLLFLPWDHSFAHTVGIYSFMYNGASLASVDFGKSPLDYLRNIPVNLREIKPHVLLSVPAIARNFRKNIETSVRQKGKFTEFLYRWGLRVAYQYYGIGNYRGKGIRYLLYPLLKGIDRLIFLPIRQSFGGNLRFFVGGGALLDTELQKYFQALGMPMYQGYGLTEASPVISSNTPSRHKFGSSGELVKPLELKICDEDGRELAKGETGEILIRGGNVMKGYWKNEKTTEEVLSGEWLHTGDMGYMDEDGFLCVLGRFKSLLIANDGEKYSPEGIEEALVEKSPYIDFCMLYNNQSPYTAGLVVPNRTALKDYVHRKGIPENSIESYKCMLSKLRSEIMEFRQGGKYGGIFPERWLPAVIAVLPEALNEQNGTINSTSKMVRRRIVERFREELDYVYTSEGKDISNIRNTRNIKRFMEGE